MEDRPRHGPAEGRTAALRDLVPRGNTLDERAFTERHALLSCILAGHVPLLFAFGIVQGVGPEHAALEVVAPALALAGARIARNRRVAACCTTAGLVFCSAVLVHLSHGSIEAHFHFFVLVGLIALYQDWVPFLWNVVFTVLSHGLGSAVAADLVYNHPAAQGDPWTWALIHGAAVLAACVGVIVFWKSTEIEQQRNTALATQLSTARAEAAQRERMSQLFVNLARRNQSLLDRQLTLIAELEQSERAPDSLAELFQLDHLATRIRRNAESLLVLSGDDHARHWGKPVPLVDVLRAAAAEVEHYQRVDIVVSEHLEIAGRAVADISHLLAELIENATQFSAAAVRVRSYLLPGDSSAVLLSIEDRGIGMTEAARRAAHELLTAADGVELLGPTMGFQVVSRLAQRYGLTVRLAHTPGGGLTALVTLPGPLVSERQALPRALAGEGQALPDAELGGSVLEPDLPPEHPVRHPSGLPGHSPAAAALPIPPDLILPGLPLAGSPPPPRRAPGHRDGRPAAQVRLVPLLPPAPRGEPTPTRPAATTGAEPHAPLERRDPGAPAEPPEPQAPFERRGPIAPLERRDPGAPAEPRQPHPQPDAVATPAERAGLERRVPGTRLSPGLRRRPPASGSGTVAATGPASSIRNVRPSVRRRDQEQMRSMLSRFQAGQRAGRALADAPVGSLARGRGPDAPASPPANQEDP